MSAPIIDHQTRELTTDGNRLVGQIDGWLTGHPGWHTPSRIARGIRSTTAETWQVLVWLDRRELFVVGSGNGNWRRYSAR